MSMISETDKISIRYYTNTYDTPEHYSHMFIEDFGRNVVPIYGSKSELITCKLDPDNKEIIKSLYEILPSYRQHFRTSFNEIILETIEYIAQHIVNRGFLVLELVKYKDVSEREFYKLETVYGKDIKIKREIITQIIPDDVAQELGKNKIEIPLEKCFVIEFPKSLGGKVKYLQFLKEFRELAMQSPMMNFLINPLQGQAGYNLTEHQRLHDLELWKITKTYNWHHREGGGEKYSGFYRIYRHLLFRKNKIKLRDHVVEELCKIVSTLSAKVLGQKAELKIDGLLTMDKVEEKIEQWKTGQLDPKTISDVL
ncbi:MAG: hypothetical protein KGP35_06835 [Bacteroidetes bacterium]|nr:hypothetical protein [Bacteroidota bacterium]